jgi:cell division protein FtsQ
VGLVKKAVGVWSWLPRRTGHRRRGRRRAALLVVLVVLLTAGLTGYGLYGSPLLRAEKVSVTGAQRLPAGTIRGAAAVPTGVPLVRVDAAAIAERVSQLPAVAAVDVRRQWPHTVRISVTERVPLLAVQRGNGYALVDAAGVAFETVPAVPGRLPEAALPSLGPTDPATLAAVGVVRALSPTLRSGMQRLEASSDSGVTLVLRDGRRVVWGANDRSQLKAEILGALLKRQGKVYDVSAPDIVTVSPH